MTQQSLNKSLDKHLLCNYGVSLPSAVHIKPPPIINSFMQFPLRSPPSFYVPVSTVSCVNEYNVSGASLWEKRLVVLHLLKMKAKQVT